MTIKYPVSQQEILNRMVSDIQNQLPEAGPFLKNNFVYALATANSARMFDNYQLLKELLNQMFPDTATNEFLDRWGGYKNVYKINATNAKGLISVTGLVGSVIPIETEFQTSDGRSYLTLSAGAVGLQSFSVQSIERSGNTVTVNTVGSHNIATGISVNIQGANQADYNGEFPVIVISDTQFIYNIGSNLSPASPATGSNIIAFYYGASLSVESVDVGAQYNLESGNQLNISTPLNGIDADAYVQISSISGGTDIETDDRYKERVIYAYQNPVALFNVAAIVDRCRQIAGVTRVFVKEVTPDVGMVTVYFTRDEDVSIIPSSANVQIVKDHLVKIKPANTSSTDVIVLAPTPVVVNFAISNLIPNTTTMQNAIKENLQTLFRENTEVDQPLLEAAYMSAIFQTVDLETGDTVKNFNLTNPTSTILINPGELPVLGEVNFS